LKQKQLEKEKSDKIKEKNKLIKAENDKIEQELEGGSSVSSAAGHSIGTVIGGAINAAGDFTAGLLHGAIGHVRLPRLKNSLEDPIDEGEFETKKPRSRRPKGLGPIQTSGIDESNILEYSRRETDALLTEAFDV
jgi:hypothetical protein